MTEAASPTETSLAVTRTPSVALADHSGATDDTELVRLWLGRYDSAGTRREYGRDAAAFLAYLAEIRATLRNLTVRDVDDYLTALPGGTATLARRVASLKSLLTFAQKTGYTHFNVGSVIKSPKLLNTLAQRILGEEDVIRMISSCRSLRDRALLRLLYVSAARVSELSALDWKHLQVKNDGSVLTLHGKGQKTRHVLLTQTITAELSELRGCAKDDEPMFLSQRGRRRMSTRGIQYLVHQLAKNASVVSDPSPHWMRHAHASHSLDRGAPIHLVQTTLGHASVATTGRYLHARPDDGSSRYLIA